jgi:hypothetical protein
LIFSFTYFIPINNLKLQVNDDLTGDSKKAQETRNGDRVEGSYQTNMPDGTIIVTEYYSDSTGYHPTVRQINPATGVTTILYSPEQHAAIAAGGVGTARIVTQQQQVSSVAPLTAFSGDFGRVTAQRIVQQPIVQRLVAQPQLTRIVETQQLPSPLVTVSELAKIINNHKKYENVTD